MARKVTKANEKAIAQWRTAWFLLPDEWRALIARFCITRDADVAAAAMRGSDLIVAD